MSKLEDLQKMHAILEAKYQVQQQAFQALIAEESALRQKLSRLSQQVADAAAGDGLQMRAIGADMMWKAWVGRTKAALNIELAQVLARKEYHVGQVRAAFGKAQAAKSLYEAQLRAAQEKQSRTQLNQAINTSLY